MIGKLRYTIEINNDSTRFHITYFFFFLLYQFSKIVLARIYFESGRYDKALEWLQHLALRLEDVETGYGLVLLVQARVIKGKNKNKNVCARAQ